MCKPHHPFPGLQVTAGILLLFLAGILHPPACAGQPAAQPRPWSGFIANEILPKLPNTLPLKNDQPFKVGIIGDAKSFAPVAEATKGFLSLRDQKKIYPRWIKAIDWDREIVVYVILTNPTNALEFDSWKLDAKGTGQLKIAWERILPLYHGYQAAFLCRVPRAGLKRLEIETNRGPLADVEVAEK